MVYQSISGHFTEKGRKKEKSKPHPKPAASTAGPCPTISKLVGCSGTESNIAPSHDPTTPLWCFFNIFLCPATKSGRVLCYTLRTFECLSVRPSVRPSVSQSAVEHSCPLHNFDTIRDNFTKLGTNINHDQTTCRD